MSPPIVYNFVAIAQISNKIDEVQNNMDNTISRMKANAETALKDFTGTARGQYDDYIKAFDAEKNKLFKILDDSQEDARKHVEKVRREEELLGQTLRRSTNELD